MDLHKLKGKKVIVAGSEGLLGQVISEKFQDLHAVVLRLDLKNGHDLLEERFVQSIMQEHRGAHVLINAFALNPQPDEASWDLFNLPLESLEKYLQVNLLALLTLSDTRWSSFLNCSI